MHPLLNALYQLYKWLIFIPLFIAQTAVLTVLTFLTSLVAPRWATYCGALWARVTQWITPVRVKVVGAEHIRRGQSYVVCANHQGAYDIIAIYGNLPLNFRWVMKKELRDVPLIGFACHRGGHIFIDRSSRQRAYESMVRAREVLVGGLSVMMFPEGHRSGTEQMGPFKQGAFHLTEATGLPILPVSIGGSYKVMSAGIPSIRPGTITLTIHPEMDTTRYASRDELAAALRQTIQTAI